MDTGIPRGIEVLVKKASVDAEFRTTLLERRSEAADAIGLELTPAEAAMLDAVPAAQLEAIIDHTTVSPMTREAFLGRVASAMIAALGASAAMAPHPGLEAGGTLGIRPGAAAHRRVKCYVYRVTNYKGRTSYKVCEARDYRTRTSGAARANGLIRRAYLRARKAWAKDRQHKGAPFPLKPPARVSSKRMDTYHFLEEAEAARRRLQAEHDKELAEREEEAKRRLDGLGERAREEEAKRAELLEQAEALLEREVERLWDEAQRRDPRSSFYATCEGIRP